MEQVEYIDWGIACRIGNTIYLNKNLLDYPILCKAILKHEYAHSPKINLNDFVIDLKGKHLNSVKKQYYKFILKNPKALLQFIPIGIYKGKLVIDPMISILWILIAISIWAMIKGVGLI